MNDPGSFITSPFLDKAFLQHMLNVSLADFYILNAPDNIMEGWLVGSVQMCVEHVKRRRTMGSTFICKDRPGDSLIGDS